MMKLLVSKPGSDGLEACSLSPTLICTGQTTYKHTGGLESRQNEISEIMWESKGRSVVILSATLFGSQPQQT